MKNRDSLLEEVYNSAFNNEIEKISMRIQDKWKLAKSVGIIPGEGNWKWGLSKLRAPSKKGARIMRTGEDLQKAKETKIGLLKRRDRKRMRDEQRTRGPGYETGITPEGETVRGGYGMVSNPNVVGHTHPYTKAYTSDLQREQRSSLRWINSELKNNDTYMPIMGVRKKAVKKVVRKGKFVPGKVVRKKPVPGKKRRHRPQPTFSKKPIDIEHERASRRIYLLKTKANIARDLDYAKKLGDPKNPMQAFPSGTTRTVVNPSKFKQLEKSYKRGRPKQELSDMRRESTDMSSDAGVFLDQQAPHTIMAKKVTGVHKYRKYQPNFFRSVYFKSGYQ